MRTTFEIPAWANGPDGSANGGYAAGLIADACGEHGVIEVNLRMPPPLATPLRVTRDDAGWLVQSDDDMTVATARSAHLRIDINDASNVGIDRATRASANFPYAHEHPFPRCLCCGTQRPAAVPSLGIHCGRVDELPYFAAPWVPSPELADAADATVASRAACFSALDCPSATPFAHPDRPAVLARFVVRLDGRARIGEPHTLVAWETGRDGRKLSSVSVLRDAHGVILGMAQALWIEVRTS